MFKGGWGVATPICKLAGTPQKSTNPSRHDQFSMAADVMAF